MSVPPAVCPAMNRCANESSGTHSQCMDLVTVESLVERLYRTHEKLVLLIKQIDGLDGLYTGISP